MPGTAVHDSRAPGKSQRDATPGPPLPFGSGAHRQAALFPVATPYGMVLSRGWVAGRRKGAGLRVVGRLLGLWREIA